MENTIPLSEATRNAENYLDSDSSFTVSSSEGYLAVVIRSQNVENLAWVIKLKGRYSWDNNKERTKIVFIDANDGSVLGTWWNSVWPESRLATMWDDTNVSG